MFMDREALIHFVGGAAGGTAGTALTCPLEVVKTRMQSSSGIETNSSGPSTSQGTNAFAKETVVADSKKGNSVHAVSSGNSFGENPRLRGQIAMQRLLGGDITRLCSPFGASLRASLRLGSSVADPENVPRQRRNFLVLRYFTHIIRNEGIGALYKGLIPNLIGVAPSKAVYFYTYSSSKRFWNDSAFFLPNSAIVHMVSAGTAGFVAASAVNPIWLVKTRLQLHKGPIGIWSMIKRVHQREGIPGFYKGVTASYAGVSETMIQFCIYEYFRGLLIERGSGDETDKRKMVGKDFLNFMVAGGSAKFIACVMAYPHEVVRTRLREESNNYRGFFRTLYSLYKEGYRAMYRGLSVQLLRTVPNTAITMGTYEFVVYMLHQV